jgi:hypothetical protein
MTSFADWLLSGITGDDLPTQCPPEELAAHFIRFNREISSIKTDWTEEELAQAIWNLYGASHCYFADLTRLPPSQLISDLFDSVEILYRDLFEPHCSHFYSHLDSGPESAKPLNSPCYMLWDMTCGIDAFTFSDFSDHVSHTFQLLDTLAESQHPATLESVIHGLGHLTDDHYPLSQPILDRIIHRKGLPNELKTYATNALQGLIQ